MGYKKPLGKQWVGKAGEGRVCSELCCLVTAGDGGVEAGGVGLGLGERVPCWGRNTYIFILQNLCMCE